MRKEAKLESFSIIYDEQTLLLGRGFPFPVSPFSFNLFSRTVAEEAGVLYAPTTVSVVSIDEKAIILYGKKKNNATF